MWVEGVGVEGVGCQYLRAASTSLLVASMARTHQEGGKPISSSCAIKALDAPPPLPPLAVLLLLLVGGGGGSEDDAEADADALWRWWWWLR